MKTKVLLIAMMIIAVISSLAICVIAQPPPDGSYPSQPGSSQYPPSPPGYSGQGNQPNVPSYPGQQVSYPSGQGYQMNASQGYQMNATQGASANHPSTGPSAGAQPQNKPSASTGNFAQNLGQGQAVTKEQLAQLGGEPTSAKTSAGGQKAYLIVTGLEQWVYYNNQWTKDPSAVYLNNRLNMLLNNDQGQYIWSYEQYPNGYVDWHNWGYLYPGYYSRIFLGDASGWHQVATWGSQSGWSNVLWIYVW